jgi:hypothetical protein
MHHQAKIEEERCQREKESETQKKKREESETLTKKGENDSKCVIHLFRGKLAYPFLDS